VAQVAQSLPRHCVGELSFCTECQHDLEGALLVYFLVRWWGEGVGVFWGEGAGVCGDVRGGAGHSRVVTGREGRCGKEGERVLGSRGLWRLRGGAGHRRVVMGRRELSGLTAGTLQARLGGGVLRATVRVVCQGQQRCAKTAKARVLLSCSKPVLCCAAGRGGRCCRAQALPLLLPGGHVGVAAAAAAAGHASGPGGSLLLQHAAGQVHLPPAQPQHPARHHAAKLPAAAPAACLAQRTVHPPEQQQQQRQP
jgi:hypothetical protein